MSRSRAILIPFENRCYHSGLSSLHESESLRWHQRDITTSLKEELDAFRTEFMAQVAPAIREAMAQADMELAVSGIAQQVLRAGDHTPDFRLPDARGVSMRLKDLLLKGPVVLSFYRGGWCPYCSLELRALQKALPEITKFGAQLVAVSPQTPDESLSTAEKNQLAFPVLSDAGSATAKAFGIAFDLADELRPIYARFGHALPEKNGDDSWVLPIRRPTLSMLMARLCWPSSMWTIETG